MGSSYEPDPKRFKIIFISSLIFLTFMAVLIIYRKTQKEKASKKEPSVLYQEHESIRISGTRFPVCWNG